MAEGENTVRSPYFGDYQVFGPQFQQGVRGPTYDTGFGPDERGQGMAGLPGGFAGWEAAARGAFGPVMDYTRNSQGIGDYFQGELNRDYQNEFFNTERAAIDRNMDDLPAGLPGHGDPRGLRRGRRQLADDGSAGRA